MATIRDVAKLAGVSVATVSAVINKKSGVKVSAKLTKKVESAIDELNYVPNRIARSLSKRENNTLGYIVPSITNQFFPQLAKVVEDIAFKNDYGVYLCNTDGQKERAQYYLDSLIENRVAGVITTLTWEIEEISFIEKILSQNIPIVGLAGARNNSNIDTVTCDDVEGTRQALRYLSKKGYKNIAFIGIENSQTTKLRLKGYKKGLIDSGICYNKDLVRFSTGFDKSEIKGLVKEMINSSPDIDAVFVFNDIMGAGVIDALYQCGRKVPEDIAVMGFDDSIAQYTFPKMTTMSIPKSEMANQAMEILFKRINGDMSKLSHIKVRSELKERNTS
ncbi:LacI family DNA-binding transcriptional regulator [Natronospora cellulosivora (SeqCode)]